MQPFVFRITKRQTRWWDERKNGMGILQKDRSILGASGPFRARGIQLLADRRLDLLVRGNELLMPVLAKVGS